MRHVRAWFVLRWEPGLLAFPTAVGSVGAGGFWGPTAFGFHHLPEGAAKGIRVTNMNNDNNNDNDKNKNKNRDESGCTASAPTWHLQVSQPSFRSSILKVSLLVTSRILYIVHYQNTAMSRLRMFCFVEQQHHSQKFHLPECQRSNETVLWHSIWCCPSSLSRFHFQWCKPSRTSCHRRSSCRQSCLWRTRGHVSRPMRPLGRGPCTVNVGEEYCIPFNDIFGPITWPKLVKILLETGVVFEIWYLIFSHTSSKNGSFTQGFLDFSSF